MKNLLVIRHAKATTSNKTLSDFDRPLVLSSRQEIEQLAAMLKSKKMFPEHLLASSAIRARTTAANLLHVMGYGEQGMVSIQSLYEADLQILIKMLHHLNPDWSNVWLVAHNPSLTELCNFLSPSLLPELSTCSAVYFEFPIQTWAELAPHEGTVLFTYK